MSSALLASRLDRYVHLDQANHPYLSWQLEQFAPVLGQRILEIGCGVGGIAKLLGERERYVGVEIEAELAEYASERFASQPECSFVHADVATLPADTVAALQAEQFDTIVSINVLEHIEDDRSALQHMASLLEPGGRLALLVPAHAWLYGKYDQLDGHFRRYSKASLGAALMGSGFEPTSMRYFNSAGALGWWLQYKLLRREVHGQGSFGAMNAILPLLRRAEALIPPPFGLSVVALCRRIAE